MIPVSYWTPVAVGLLILLIAAMQWFGKLPAVVTVRQGFELLNSRGGNIVVLSIFAFYFFAHSMKLFYYAIGLLVSKALSPDNAIMLMGLQFAMGSAFGGVFGALLKTMTSTAEVASRSTDSPIVNPELAAMHRKAVEDLNNKESKS